MRPKKRGNLHFVSGPALLDFALLAISQNDVCSIHSLALIEPMARGRCRTRNFIHACSWESPRLISIYGGPLTSRELAVHYTRVFLELNLESSLKHGSLIKLSFHNMCLTRVAYRVIKGLALAQMERHSAITTGSCDVPTFSNSIELVA